MPGIGSCTRAFVALLCSSLAQAQTSPSFEVTSIKRWREAYSRGLTVQGSLLRATTSLKTLIAWAFDVQSEDIVGLPAWADSEEYEVLAKASRPINLTQMKLLSGTMLADRFGVRFHRDTKIVSGYVLLRHPKNPVKLPEAEAGTPQDGVGSVQVGQHEIGTRGLSMGGLTRYLAKFVLHAPVEDQTGLPGIYNFKLQFDDPAQGDASADAGFGSVFSVLDGVGLKLKRERVPVKTIRVDEIKRPELDGDAAP